MCLPFSCFPLFERLKKVPPRNTGYPQEYKLPSGVQVTLRNIGYPHEYRLPSGIQITSEIQVTLRNNVMHLAVEAEISVSKRTL